MEKIQAFGLVYVLAAGPRKKKKEKERPVWKTRPKVEDLYKEMNKQLPSRHYVNSLLTKLEGAIKGLELVRSDGDVYLSMLLEDREIIIAPIFKDDSVSISVERLGKNGNLRTNGSVEIGNETNFHELSEQIKKFVDRAKTSSL